MEPVWPDPPLVGGRIRLRPWVGTDAEALARAWTDPEIAAWNQVPADTSLAAAQRWIDGVDSRRRSALALDLVIETRTHGVPGGAAGPELVGEVGLAGFDWTRRAALVGYWLAPEARGAGHASTALALVALWATRPAPDGLGLDLVVAQCHPDNPASGAVASRAGFSRATADRSGHELWRFDRRI